MAKLVYSGLTSLDGYTADARGNFDWAMPTAEIHSFVNEKERQFGTMLYGRRLYEVMHVWQHVVDDDSAEMNEYADIWRAADKIVYSTTLDEVTTPKTTLERTFDLEAIEALKASATMNLAIGGAGLAANAIRAGLVDEVSMYLNPVVVGGGTAFWPDDVRVDLELIDTHRFENGVVYVSYAVR